MIGLRFKTLRIQITICLSIATFSILKAEEAGLFYEVVPHFIEEEKGLLTASRGEVLLHLSMPYANAFQSQPKGESLKNNIGFWGYALGLDYYYADNRFLNFRYSAATDFFLPVPLPVAITGGHEVMSTSYFGFSNNYQYKRLTIGYGLSHARNLWQIMYFDGGRPEPIERETIKKRHNAIGLYFPAHLRIGKNFHFGIIYRPTIFSLSYSKPFLYEHLISLDLGWKIRLWGK